MSTKTLPIIIAVCALLLATLACGSSTDTAAPKATATPDPMMACVMAQGFAEKYLKSPSTAKWGLCNEGITDLGNGEWSVLTHVDSENSFGASLRTKFLAIVANDGGNRWELLSLLSEDTDGETTILYQTPDLTATPVAVGPAVTATAKFVTSDPTRSPSTAKGPTVKMAANLRAGPGITYAKIGSAAVGQALDIVGRNEAGDWYQLAGGAWIFADLVANPPAAVPVATVIPTPAAAAPGAVKAAAAIPAVSGNANAFTCAGGCAVAPDPSCAIKGNVNSDQVKIYHTRGQQNYDDTDIKPEEGDRWFCTEAEARAAGFRVAQR